MSTQPSLARRIVAATLLGGAITGGAMAVAATADARPSIDPTPAPAPASPRPSAGAQTSSIAYSPETGVWTRWNNAPSYQNADAAALNLCQDRNGTNCSVVGRAGINQCVALAVDAVNWRSWHVAGGSSVIAAETAALQGPGSRIATVACTSSGGAVTGTAGHVNQVPGT